MFYGCRHIYKLLKSLKLKEGWDGEGGRAPYKRDVKNAIVFMKYLPYEGIRKARVAIAGDGAVGFDWRYDNIVFEAEFNDGDIAYFAKMKDGSERGGEYKFEGQATNDLLELIEMHFGK